MPRNTHIQLTWTDLSNITRCQVVTKEMFENHFKTKGASLAECVLTLPYSLDRPTFITPVQVTLFPDTQTLKSIDAWAPRGQLCFGVMRNDDGQPSPCCPRSFLIRQLDLLSKVEVDVTVGFELEFFLLNTNLTPVDTTLYSETKSFHGKRWVILTEIVDTLTDFGIPVWRYHSEAAAGQFEISIGPMPATVCAADSLVLTRETIYHIAEKHGKKATFVPKPFKGMSAGAHMHVSLQHGGKNLFQENPSKAHAFLAGVLTNLSNLMPILAPTGNSYERLKPLTFSGVYQCMGTENKDAALRLLKNKNGVISRFEVKPIDGTSNPYLMLGAVIGAGLHGIRESLPLPPEIDVDPSELPDDQKPPLLPSTLSEAIDVFESSEISRQIFGDDVIRQLAKVRRIDLEHWESLVEEESIEAGIKLLLQRF